MSVKYRRRAIDRIKFPIGAKLIIIISFILIFSLGSIIALVSWLVRDDLQRLAEENNMEINRRSAMEAELVFANIRSGSRILMQTITAVGPGTETAKESVSFFFNENSQTAALFFVVPEKDEQLFINTQFFYSHEIDESLADTFFHNQRNALARAIRGETVLINAAPYFGRSCLAMFFPWQDAGIGGVLFASENLNNNFGFGTNQSYMINSDGDILVSSDFFLVRSGMNIANEDFIGTILNDPERNKQQLIEADLSFLNTSAEIEISDFFSEWLEKIKPFWNNIKQKSVILIDRAAGFITGLNLKKQTGEADSTEDDAGKKRHFLAYTKLNIAGAVVITSIEYDTVFEGIAATTRRNILLTIAVLSISIIFIWFFSKTISIPLRGLANIARRIEGGIFEMDFESKSKDEIGVLTSSFQKMCSALHIFGRFTNKDIAVKAMRGLIKPGGLPKHGTVFFSDIREFTAKSENFTKHFGEEASDKIVFWLNNYFTYMIDCIEKTDGVVDKFIGDAVMAHWGTAYTAGSPRKDAFNCVKAALMMRKELYYLNKERKAGDPADPPIRIGCGINTGIVTAGQLGSDKRMEYTVIGDPVNLASRIEALTKPLGADILISEDTWLLVGDKFITEEMPSVSVKGKEKPVRIFAVVNFEGESKGPQSLAQVREILGIEAPDINKVDVNADEKKYKIGSADQIGNDDQIGEK